MAVITFGKYNGKDTEYLAKSSRGRSYLAWGAENLRSPKWRKEFQKALEAFELDLNIEADIIAKEDGLAWDEAYEHAKEEKEAAEKEQAASDAYDKAIENLKINLSNIGIPSRHINRLSSIVRKGDVDEAIEAKAIKFSSKEKESNFLSVVAQFEIEVEEVIW